MTPNEQKEIKLFVLVSTKTILFQNSENTNLEFFNYRDAEFHEFGGGAEMIVTIKCKMNHTKFQYWARVEVKE